MINIKLVPNKFLTKPLFILIMLIIIFISSSKIVFSKELNKNIKNLSTPEEELALKYCDAINKKFFIGLDNEALLKYEYYFSNIKGPYLNDPKIFFEGFKSNLKKICSYKLIETEEQEIFLFIKKFLKIKYEK